MYITYVCTLISLEIHNSSVLSLFFAGWFICLIGVNAICPTVHEGITSPSSLRRSLTRLRGAALLLLLESLYHSSYFGEDITRQCRSVPRRTDCLGNTAANREKERGGHGRCSRSSPPSCRAAGLGSVCTEAEWSFSSRTLRTGLTSSTYNNSTGQTA